MIPTRSTCLLIFDKYKLPSEKKIHVEEVARLALFFADKLANNGIKLNKDLVEAAALLHDIDKNITKLEGEKHPQAAVRILNEMDLKEVAIIVEKHALHTILEQNTKPATWEEKIVYLADKMTKYEIMGVDQRFKLWYRENLPKEAVEQLNQAFPKVKELEKEIFTAGKISFADIQRELINI